MTVGVEKTVAVEITLAESCPVGGTFRATPRVGPQPPSGEALRARVPSVCKIRRRSGRPAAHRQRVIRPSASKRPSSAPRPWQSPCEAPSRAALKRTGGARTRPASYARVSRLPGAVHRQLTSLDFPTRPAPPSSTSSSGTSRFSRKVLPCTLRLYDRAKPRPSRDSDDHGVADTRGNSGSAWYEPRLHGSIARLARAPVNTSPVPLRVRVHDSGTRWFATPFSSETFTLNTLPVYPGESPPPGGDSPSPTSQSSETSILRSRMFTDSRSRFLRFVTTPKTPVCGAVRILARQAVCQSSQRRPDHRSRSSKNVAA